MSYTDLQYSEAGAFLVDDVSEVFGADIVLKITPPEIEELNFMQNRSTVFSMLQLSNLSKEAIELIMLKKMNAFAYELIKDEQKAFPVVNSIAEIEGNTAIAVISHLIKASGAAKAFCWAGVAGITPPEMNFWSK